MLAHLLEVHLLPVYAFEELVFLHFGGSASEEHKAEEFQWCRFYVCTLDGSVRCITSI